MFILCFPDPFFKTYSLYQGSPDPATSKSHPVSCTNPSARGPLRADSTMTTDIAFPFLGNPRLTALPPPNYLYPLPSSIRFCEFFSFETFFFSPGYSGDRRFTTSLEQLLASFLSNYSEIFPLFKTTRGCKFGSISSYHELPPFLFPPDRQWQDEKAFIKHPPFPWPNP